MSHPLRDLRVVDAHVVGIVDHQRRGAVRDGGLQRIERRIAVLLQHERDHLEARGRGGGRVAGMRLDRGDDLVALLELAARGVVGAGDAGGGRRHRRRRRAGRRTVHAGQLAERSGRSRGRSRARPAASTSSWCGMELGDRVRAASGLVDARVVLHRAGAEEADAHHPIVSCDEVQVVAQHFGLGHLRQRRRRVAPHRRAVSGGGRRPRSTPARRRDRCRGGRARPARGSSGSSQTGGVVAAERGHRAITSASASASRSRSSWRVDLGHAVEGALAELRKSCGEVLAAEDAPLAQRLVDLGDRCGRWRRSRRRTP